MRPPRVDWFSIAAIGVIGGTVLGLVVLGGAAAYYLLASSAEPTPAPLPTLVLAAPGSISGRVWHDQCAVAGGHAGAPLVPSAGCVPATGGGYQADGIHDPAEPPLAGARVDLGLGGCPAAVVESSQALGDGTFVFANLPEGTYCVSIRADDQPLLQLVPGRWTHPAGTSGVTAEVTVALAAGEIRGGIDFGWDYEFLPVPDTPSTGVPAATPTAVACTDLATFVADVTVPDGTLFQPGASFDKVWRLRNTGTCSWGPTYAVAFISGTSMGASAAEPLPRSVPPGETIDLQLRLTAPLTPGSYRGNWMLRNPTGVHFGTGTAGQTALWTLIHVGDPAAGGAIWRGEYFANRRLSGSPTLVRTDTGIDFDWGSDAPAAELPADDFSVRWTTAVDLEGGTYDFRLLMDDGARLWIDDKLIIDEWKDGAVRERGATVELVRGRHNLKVEYYERTQRARVRLTWTRVTRFPDWKGEYFGNRDLRAPVALVRNDRNVDFDWGTGAPVSGMSSDSFSVRWTTKITFDPGRYRLNAVADDGVRVYINGGMVINEWHDSSGSETYRVEVDLAGTTDVMVEYYERSGRAKVRFWYERVGTATPTASSTPSPTATASAAATATATATGTATATPTPSGTPTPSQTPTPSETPTITPTPTATCQPIECDPPLP